jgi:hypothetical protein
MSDPSSNPARSDSRPSNAIVPKAPLSRTVCWLVASLCLLGALCLLAFAFLPLSTTASDAQGDVRQVSILHRGLAEAIPLVLLAGFVQLLAAGVILLVRKRLLFGILLLLVAILASSGAYFVGFIQNLGPWTICDQITTSDGTQYYFIDSSFLQGQTMAIARLKSVDPVSKTLDVLGTNNGDNPRSYLLVVRPASIKPVLYGALYLTPDGRQIVGLRCANECYMVYDLVTRQFFGHDDVEQLSPFLLLNDKSPLYAPDEANIVTSFSNSDNMGLPTRQSLTEALAHPNPAVRKSAAGMLQVAPPDAAKPHSTDY